MRFSMLLEELSESLTWCSEKSAPLQEPRGILFLYGEYCAEASEEAYASDLHTQDLDPSYVYITDGATCKTLFASHEIPAQITLLVAGHQPRNDGNERAETHPDAHSSPSLAHTSNPITHTELPVGMNLAISTLPAQVLYNRVFANLMEYRSLYHHISLQEHDDLMLHDILATMSVLLESEIYFFDNSLKLVATQQGRGDELPLDKALYQQVESLVNTLEHDGTDKEGALNSTSGTSRASLAGSTKASTSYPLLHKVRYVQTVAGYLYLPCWQPSERNQNLLFALERQLIVFAASYTSTNTLGNIRFKSILHELMGSGVKDYRRIRNSIDQLPSRPGPYLRFGVVTIDDSARRRMFLKCLVDQYPDWSIASYKEYIVVLFSGNNQLFMPTLNVDTIERILIEHDATMMISNAASRMSAHPAHFKQCVEVLETVVPVTGLKQGRRIQYFEEYATDYTIWLCVQANRQRYSDDGLIYLSNPITTILHRYDRTYDSDLLEFMYAYIMNSCSIAKTARQLYIHRNTAVYKLNKIVELTNADFEDGHVRMRLAMSYLILKFVENSSHAPIGYRDFSKKEFE